MKNRFLFLLITGVCTLLYLSSCNKKEGCTDATANNFDAEAEVNCCCEYDTLPAETNAKFSMHLHQYVGSEIFVPGNVYEIGGVKTQIDVARFYVSNIRLVDSSGAETAFAGTYLLADPGYEEYELGEIPHTGTYTKIRFDVGLDEEANHSDPGDYPASSPLSYQSPAMNWGWDFGYMFVLVHGLVDTDGDDVTDATLINHLGTDEFLTPVEIDYNITSVTTAENTIHLQVNWADFYDGVNLAVDYQTEVTDDPVLADKLINNVPGMISTED